MNTDFFDDRWFDLVNTNGNEKAPPCLDLSMIDAIRKDWLAPVNQMIIDKASEYQWVTVRCGPFLDEGNPSHLQDLFAGHGYCASGGERWITTFSDSMTRMQGSPKGLLHLNAAGCEAIARYMANFLNFPTNVFASKTYSHRIELVFHPEPGILFGPGAYGITRTAPGEKGCFFDSGYTFGEDGMIHYTDSKDLKPGVHYQYSVSCYPNRESPTHLSWGYKDEGSLSQ
jgi:hypothetical protein